MRIIWSLLTLFFICCVDPDPDSNLNLSSKGHWSGLFHGNIEGDISFTSDRKGIITGYIIPVNSQDRNEIGGGISRDGLVTFNSRTMSFQGFLSSESRASGRWTMNRSGGTWTIYRYK